MSKIKEVVGMELILEWAKDNMEEAVQAAGDIDQIEEAQENQAYIETMRPLAQNAMGLVEMLREIRKHINQYRTKEMTAHAVLNRISTLVSVMEGRLRKLP